MIKKLITKRKPAFARGEALRLRAGYPALLANESGSLVGGELLELDAPESFFSILDELLQVDRQGKTKSLFVRQTLSVQTDNYNRQEAEAYVLNPLKKVKAHIKISGEDWQKNMDEDPPINEYLEERHQQYIRKLSRSKGRDIVPIKLDLYRELLNLGLIVDKGRRLGLTPLGKEAEFFVVK